MRPDRVNRLLVNVHAFLLVEETLDIGDIFPAAIALARQTAAETELAVEADGDDGADVGDLHEELPPRF